MNNIARKHHFIPEFFLAGFTQTGLKDTLLCVFDKKEVRQLKLLPKNIAMSKGFYAIKTTPHSKIKPDELERLIGQFENEVAPIIREIGNTEKLPRGKEFILLLHFFALLAARTPTKKELLIGPEEKIINQYFKIILSSEEMWKAALAKTGLQQDDLDYNLMKENLLGVKMTQHGYIERMLEEAQDYAKLLSRREWTLGITDERSNEFVCSDYPLLLLPVRCGFGTPGSLVAFPVNKRMVLMGYLTKEMKGGAFIESKKMMVEDVAFINRWLISYSERFIYSSSEDIIWMCNDGKIGKKGDLVEAYKRKHNITISKGGGNV